MNLESLKYPIGKFHRPASYDEEPLTGLIAIIEEFPSKIRALTEKLDNEELNMRYRPDGWTIKQVVHHCADSHMNSFIRFKWTLTEDTPVIKAYDEASWANLPDSLSDDISNSLDFLASLHARWVFLLRNLSEEELNREFVHPEHGRKMKLNLNIAIYAWHSQHHLAHVEQALKYRGNFPNLTEK